MSRSRSLLAVAVVGAVVVACAGNGGGEPAGEPDTEPPASEPTAEDDAEDAAEGPEPELRLVATLEPTADLVARVGGERVEVDPLVPPGADAHTYEPRPGDVRALADADAYLGIGLDLNPGALALAEENLDEDRVVLLGDRYLSVDELVLDHVHDDEGGHGHGDEGGHSHGDEGGHGHDHADAADGAGPNPHVWTGLGEATLLVDGIADTLSELDPAGADAYDANARALREDIEDLDGRIREAVATIDEQDRTLVVYHDAWSYFARDYGFEMVTAVQPSDYSEPSAADVRDIIDLIREHDVPALFGSDVFPTDVLDTISAETGAVYVGDLEDDVLPGEPGDEEHSYLGLMRRNAAMIVEGLGGDATAISG